MKQAMKESAPFQREGIMSISRSLSGNVDAKVKKWVESAKRQGQDIDKMSEQEIKYLIELNKPKAPKVYSNEEAYKILSKFLNQGKKDKGKVIEFPKDKITDWTKSQSRPPETEIIGGIQTTRGLGDLFGKQLDRTVNVRIVVEDIKKLEPIEAMKEANKVLKGEGRYKSLSKADREKIAGDESVTDHIFEREIKPDPEDFAQGGRTGLSYLLAEDTNERMPFSMGRRAFLKLMGGVGAGIGALKAGALSMFGKGTGKQAAKEVVKDVATTSSPPPYFFNLVNKIKTLGDDTLATKDKVIAKKYKDYVMEEDFAGNIEIMKKGGDDMFPEDVYMSYKVDEVPIKGKKGSTKVEEYEEFTARPDMEGKMKDVEEGVPDEVVEEGTMFEDNITDFGKASGGLARMLGE